MTGAPTGKQDAPTPSQDFPVYPAQGFVFHHSGGTTLAGLRATLKDRGLGSQYLMDRDGTIYNYGGAGASHILPNDRTGGIAHGLSNANAVGMEIVARDDSDLTPQQVASAQAFIQRYYPTTPVYGHGEVNPGHKQATEGMTVTNAIRQARALDPTQQAPQNQYAHVNQYPHLDQPTSPSPGPPQNQPPQAADESYLARVFGASSAQAGAPSQQQLGQTPAPVNEPPMGPSTTTTPTSPPMGMAAQSTPTTPAGPQLPDTYAGTTIPVPPSATPSTSTTLPQPPIGQTPAPQPLGQSQAPQPIGMTPAPIPAQLGTSTPPPQLGMSANPPPIGQTPAPPPPPQLGMTPAPAPPHPHIPTPQPAGHTPMEQPTQATLGATMAPGPPAQLGMSTAPETLGTPSPTVPTQSYAKYEAALRLEAAGQLPPQYQQALDRLRAAKGIPDLPPFTPESPIYAATAEKYRLPPGLLPAMAGAGVAHNPNGFGLMEVDPKRGGRYGVTPTNLTNPYIQVEAAGHFLRDALDTHKGDLTAALAAWNPNPSYHRSVMEGMARYGTSDPAHTPPIPSGEPTTAPQGGTPGAAVGSATAPPSPSSSAVAPPGTPADVAGQQAGESAGTAFASSMARRLEKNAPPVREPPPDVPADMPGITGSLARGLHSFNVGATAVDNATRAVDKYNPFALADAASGAAVEGLTGNEKYGDYGEWIPTVASLAPMAPGLARAGAEVIGTPGGIRRIGSRVAEAVANRVGGERTVLQAALDRADAAVASARARVTAATTDAAQARAQIELNRAEAAATAARAQTAETGVKAARTQAQAELPTHAQAAVSEAQAATPDLLAKAPPEPPVPANVRRRANILGKTSEGVGPYGERPTTRTLRSQSVVKGNPKGSIKLADVDPSVVNARVSPQAAQNALDRYTTLVAEAGEAKSAAEAQAKLREAVDLVHAHFPGIKNAALETLEAASQHVEALDRFLADTSEAAARTQAGHAATRTNLATQTQAATARAGAARQGVDRATELQQRISRRLGRVGPTDAETARMQSLEAKARRGGSVPWRMTKSGGRLIRRTGFEVARAAGLTGLGYLVFSNR